MNRMEEIFQMDEDAQVAATPGVNPFIPKLRKNRKLENRWGLKYLQAMKDTVFTLRSAPYMPTEAPSSLGDEASDCQPLYVCKQCRDCFRFLSSLEYHQARRSWILGYWCQKCLGYSCSHKANGEPACLPCQDSERQKKLFLKIRRKRKLGCIKIFYNQCQFFAHLKTHQVNMVDMGDVMLMPIPVDIETSQYSELEKLCEIIMEHMFITRRHIMDWLQSMQLGNKWWKALLPKYPNGESSTAEILATIQSIQNDIVAKSMPSKKIIGYTSSTSKLTANTVPVGTISTLNIASTSQKKVEDPNKSIENQSCTAISNANRVQSSATVTSIDPLEPLEDDNNPSTTADIAFVDCGPAAKTYPAETPFLCTSMSNLGMKTNANNSINTTSSLPNATAMPFKVASSRNPNSTSAKYTNTHVVYATSSAITSSVSSSMFTPKISVKKFASERTKSPLPGLRWKEFPQEQSSMNQTLNKVPCRSNVNVANSAAKHPLIAPKPEYRAGTSKPSLMTLKPSLQDSALKSNQRVLTVHSPRNADISAIINQLPPQVINGKKILFIGQDSERYTILPKSDGNSGPGMIQIKSEPSNAKIIKTVPFKVTPPLMSSKQSGKNFSGSMIQKMLSDPIGSDVQEVSLDGRIIYQNGRKFIIRHTPKPGVSSSFKMSNNSSKLRLLSKPSTTTVTRAIAPKPIAPKRIVSSTGKILLPPLTPSPSASEHSNSSNCDAQRKQDSDVEKNDDKPPGPILSTELRSSELKPMWTPESCTNIDPNAIEHLTIETDTAGQFYFNVSRYKAMKHNKNVNWSYVASKCKQQMTDNLLHLSKAEIKRRLDHLKAVNNDYSKMMSVTRDQRILGNLEAMKYLEIALEEPSLWDNDEEDSDQDSDDEDISDTEVHLQQTKDSPKCPTCERPTKPESYIVGFSKLPEDRSAYCNCSNYLCDKCNVFQGNMTRFDAHLNFHAKQEPYTCPECFKKCPSLHRLEMHTWTSCFHPLTKRWFMCKVCHVEGFTDMDSLTRHFVIMHSESKIACPECRILVKSRAALRKHAAAAHPTVSRPLKPVSLIVCDVGQCVTRPENFRDHMDDHLGVLRMLYYKCPFCSFIVNETYKGKDQIKSHLYNCHLERFSELVSSESLPEIMLAKQVGKVKRQLQVEHTGENAEEILNHGVPTTEVFVDSRNIIESEQDQEMTLPRIIDTRTVTDENAEEFHNADNRAATTPEISHSEGDNIQSELEHGIVLPKIINTRTITPEVFEQTSQDPAKSSADGLNPMLTKQTLKNGMECSIRSINLNKTYLSQTTAVRSEDSKLAPTVQDFVDISNDSTTLDCRELPGGHRVESVSPHSPVKQPDTTEQPHNFHGVVSQPRTTLDKRLEISEKVVETQEKNASAESSEQLGKSMKETSEKAAESSEEAQMELDEGIRRSTSNEDEIETTLLSKTTEKESTESDENNLENTTNDDEVYIIKPFETAEVLTRSVKRPKENTTREKEIVTTEPKADTMQCNSTLADDCVPNLHGKLPGMPELISLQSEDGNEKMNNPEMRSILRPPPLARIPHHLLIQSKVEEKLEENMEVFQDQIPEIPIESVIKRRRRRRRPWRIALNGPICYTEDCNYCCHLCGEMINTAWPVINSHFSSRHSRDYKLSIITPRLLRMSDEFIKEGYKVVLSTRKRRPEGGGPGSKKRRRWSSRRNPEKSPQGLLGEGFYVKPESVQDDNGNFICKKCDHRCDDMSKLREHIATTHRIKDHYLVCLECGENFVVAPSLQMHLKAFHAIEDPIIYMTRNTAYAPEVTEGGESESKTGIANQCDVCNAVFEDKAAVDKHLRVHGMAFLKRKRIEARNASLSPEKKPKPENAEENSVDNRGKDAISRDLDQSLISCDK